MHSPFMNPPGVIYDDDGEVNDEEIRGEREARRLWMGACVNAVPTQFRRFVVYV